MRELTTAEPRLLAEGLSADTTPGLVVGHSGASLDEVAIELGIYFVLVTVCMFLLLDQFGGKIDKLHSWVLRRRLEVFKYKSRNSYVVERILTVGCYAYIYLPFLALAGWTLLIMYDTAQDGKAMYPGFCILCVGLAYLIIMTNVFRIQWTNYRVKSLNRWLLVVALVLIFIYQAMNIFGYEDQEKFLPYSALFLNVNCTILCLLTFLNKHEASKDTLTLLERHFPETGTDLSRDREAELLVEIEDQRDDENWKPSMEDLKDMVTISEVSEAKFADVLGSGALKALSKMPDASRYRLKVGLVVTAVATLAVYMFVLWAADDSSKMGFVISVTVTIMDCFNALLYFSGLVETDFTLCVLLFLNRILMIGLGQYYWLYGCMLLYICYASVFVYKIAKKFYPLDSEIIVLEAGLKDIWKAQNRLEAVKQGVSPTLLCLILSLLYLALLAAIEYVDFAGKKIEPIVISATGEELVAWVAAGLSYLAVLTLFLIFALIRVMIRDATKCENSATEYRDYLEHIRPVDRMLFYIILLWAVAVGWGGVLTWIYHGAEYMVWAALATPVVLFYGRAFVYFYLNEFEYFQDVEALNKWIDRHNARVVEARAKKKQLREDLMSGKLVLPPPEPADDPAPPAPKDDGGQEQEQEDKIEDLPPGGGEEPAGEDPNAAAAAEAERQRKQEERQQKMKQRMEEIKAREEEERRKAEEKRAADAQDAAEQERLRKEEEAERERIAKMEKQKALEREREAARQEQQRKEREARMKANAEKQREEQKKRNAENKQPQGKSKYSFGGSVQKGKFEDFSNVKSRGGGGGIYEGGGEEDPDPAPAADIETGEQPRKDSTIDYDSKLEQDRPIDMDKALARQDGYKIISKNELQRVVDWRLVHDKSVYKALRALDLRPNDLRLLASFFVSGLFLIILIAVLLGVADSPVHPVATSPLWYVAVCLAIGATVVNQSRAFTMKERIVWVVFTFLYLAGGVAFLAANWEGKPEGEEDGPHPYAYFVVLYLLFVPAVTHGLVVLLRYIDRGTDGMRKDFKMFIGGFALCVVLMVLAVFLFVRWVDGVAFLGGLLLVMYFAGQLYMFVMNDFYLEERWLNINRAIVACMVLAAFVVSLFVEEMSEYAGASYSMLVLLCLLWGFGVFHFAVDFSQRDERPVHYSLTIFPIFKFDPKRNDVVEHYLPMSAWIFGVVLVTLWTLLTNNQLKPTWFGPLILLLLQDMVLLSILYTQQLTLDSMNNAFTFMTDKIAKDAWLDAKTAYCRQKGAFSRGDMDTYRRMWIKRYYAIAQEAFLRDTMPALPDKTHITEDLYAEITGGGKEAFKARAAAAMETLVDEYQIKIDDRRDIASLVNELTQRVKQAYREEMQLIIRFLLISAQNAKLQELAEKKKLLKFLEYKNELLTALDIHLLVPSYGTIPNKYSEVTKQIEQLSADDLEAFNQVKALFHAEAQLTDAERAKKVEEEKAKEAERRAQQDAAAKDKAEALRRLMEEQERKRQEAAGQAHAEAEQREAYLNQDPAEMPDCMFKYELIVARAKAGKGKFTDAAFVGDESCLGDGLHQENLGGRELSWLRMSEHTDDDGKGFTIFEDGVDINDITQGALGDCYYLSALGVLGSALTRDRFCYVDTDDEWMQCGALCLKFYNKGEEEIIIIDDVLPMLAGGRRFPFVSTRAHNELWPHFLEKAYAKKFGSYKAIEGGFVSNALADLTNGIPDSLQFKDHPNLQELWGQIRELMKEGAMLGAGSNSHPQGDSAESPKGIVQGHAYCIFRVEEVDGTNLVQLRNPHGCGEWSGDWGDQSEQWTTRMRNILNYHVSEEDGLFWMDFNDFVEEFRCVYVCRSFDRASGWTCTNIEGEWSGDRAAGLPTAKNKNCKVSNNPQYQLTVSQPGKVYCVCRLHDLVNNSSSRLYQYMNFQDGDGELIRSLNKKQTLAQNGPINGAVQSMAIELPKGVSYPHKFALLVANMAAGEEGEDKFSIQFFAKGGQPALKSLN